MQKGKEVSSEGRSLHGRVIMIDRRQVLRITPSLSLRGAVFEEANKFTVLIQRS